MAVVQLTLAPCLRTASRYQMGSSVQVGAAEAAQASEVLFCPLLVGSEGRGVVDVALDAVAAAPVELQPKLLGNVVVTGGATCSDGFGCRFFNEMRQRVRGSSAPLTSYLESAHLRVLSRAARLRSVDGGQLCSAAYEEEGEAA
ncbi:hypothetical protein LSCM1_00832 [Leishmania martiniquensis]|uniref:Actin-like protein n=1 Tax=Leishmania martiniquensis TaxID=1580590 RepID=A0A836GYM2_9TRYP|nr:hypothetical protein LSCM1_00832 [Leishmania martiniquensis]